MSELIDPNTNQTTRHGDWITLLISFTKDRDLIGVAMNNGVRPTQLLHLGTCIAVHEGGKPMECKCDGEWHKVSGKLTDPQLAKALLLFIEDRTTRRAAADHMVRHFEGGDHADAMKDLLEVKNDCVALRASTARRLDSGIVMVGQ